MGTVRVDWRSGGDDCDASVVVDSDLERPHEHRDFAAVAGLREGLLSLVFKETRNERDFELVDIVQLEPGTQLEWQRFQFCQ